MARVEHDDSGEKNGGQWKEHCEEAESDELASKRRQPADHERGDETGAKSREGDDESEDDHGMNRYPTPQTVWR